MMREHIRKGGSGGEFTHETSPSFDSRKFSFKCSDRLRDELRLTSHFKESGVYEKIQSWSGSRVEAIGREKGAML